ncbi:hypothetical protein ACLESD_09825 [Pyxidicoccus sp. 3LFB2]
MLAQVPLVVALLLSSAPDVGSAAASSNPEPAPCVGGREVTFDPKEQRAAFAAVKDLSSLSRLMKALNFKAAEHLEDCKGPGGSEPEPPSSVALDVFKAALSSGQKRDLVLQVRGTACDSRLLDGVLLRPLAEKKKAYCAIPVPFLPRLVHHQMLASTAVFAFVQLTDERRQSIRVDAYEAEPGTALLETSTTTFWDFEPRTNTFRELFMISNTNGRSGFHSPSGWSEFEVTVAKDGDFPRQLSVKESSTTCPPIEQEVTMPSGEEVSVPGSGECTTTKNAFHACLRGQKYERC